LSVDFSFKERDIERVQNRVAQIYRPAKFSSNPDQTHFNQLIGRTSHEQTGKKDSFHPLVRKSVNGCTNW